MKVQNLRSLLSELFKNLQADRIYQRNLLDSKAVVTLVTKTRISLFTHNKKIEK